MSMRAIAVGCAVSLSALSGCGTDRLYQAQADLQESARRSADNAIVWRQRFLECVTTYSRTHQGAAQLASELANAALADCRTPLDAFSSAQVSYRTSLAVSGISSSNDYAAATRRGEYEAQRDRDELVQDAREIAAKAFVEGR